MGELIVIAAIGVACAIIGTAYHHIARRRAIKRQISKRISQIPFWDIEK